MEICLHLGVHRTGTTTFQRFMKRNGFAEANGRDGIAFWGPLRTRRGLFSGLIRNPDQVYASNLAIAQRSCGRIKMQTARMALAGVSHLVVSEENMIGTMAQNLSAERPYAQIRARLGAFAPAFGGQNLRISLSIRSYHSYWASSLAHRIKAGQNVPSTEMLDRLVTQPRRWRDVICDVAQVFPEADITVMPFEGTIDDTRNQLNTVLGQTYGGKLRDRTEVCNASPGLSELTQILRERSDDAVLDASDGTDDRYMPFDPLHIDKMRADYDHDIAWLLDGAEGKASYLNPIGDTSEGIFDIEGTSDDREERLDRAS